MQTVQAAREEQSRYRRGRPSLMDNERVLPDEKRALTRQTSRQSTPTEAQLRRAAVAAAGATRRERHTGIIRGLWQTMWRNSSSDASPTAELASSYEFQVYMGTRVCFSWRIVSWSTVRARPKDCMVPPSTFYCVSG